MNRDSLKNLIKECLKEVGEEMSQDDSIHVPGYAVVGVNRTKQRVEKELLQALEAVRKGDWKTANHIIGRKGNGVIPAFITALRDHAEGKGIVTYDDQGAIKNIS